MKESDIESFHYKWMDCKHCKKILKAMKQAVDKIFDSIEEDEQIIRERYISKEFLRITWLQNLLEKRLDRNIIQNYSEDFQIKVIFEICKEMEMGEKTFQDHLQHHLLYFNALKKVGRYKITLGENYEQYITTVLIFEFIKQIKPNNFNWHNGIGFYSGLRLSDKKIKKQISNILEMSLKDALFDESSKDGYIIPDLLIIDVGQVLSSNKNNVVSSD